MPARVVPVVIAAVVLATVGCWPPPGQGPKAARGYQRAAPVIAALAQYRQAHGAFPDSLRELVPNYLADSALAVPTRTQEQYPLEYRADSGGYELAFRYVGPGMNVCRYRSAAAKWNCGGYF